MNIVHLPAGSTNGKQQTPEFILIVPVHPLHFVYLTCVLVIDAAPASYFEFEFGPVKSITVVFMDACARAFGLMV